MPTPRTSGSKYLRPYNYSHENVPDWLVVFALCIFGAIVLLIIKGRKNNSNRKGEE